MKKFQEIYIPAVALFLNKWYNINSKRSGNEVCADEYGTAD